RSGFAEADRARGVAALLRAQSQRREFPDGEDTGGGSFAVEPQTVHSAEPRPIILPAARRNSPRMLSLWLVPVMLKACPAPVFFLPLVIWLLWVGYGALNGRVRRLPFMKSRTAAIGR